MNQLLSCEIYERDEYGMLRLEGTREPQNAKEWQDQASSVSISKKSLYRPESLSQKRNGGPQHTT